MEQIGEYLEEGKTIRVFKPGYAYGIWPPQTKPLWSAIFSGGHVQAKGVNS